MFPTITIGSFVFPTAGLVYIFGAWFCLSLVEWAARRLQLRAEIVYGVAATAVFVGIVGARITFVLQYWPAFRDNLLGIVWPLTSGYNVAGGLFLGLAGAFFYGRAKRVLWPATIDALIPGVILALMVISLADFLAGPGYGTLTSAPWGISQFGVRRHPVQIYEMGVGIAAFAAWWRLQPRRAYAGQLALVTTAVYSSGRLFVEAFRDNAWLTSGGYHIVQIIALAVLLAALFWLSRRPAAPQPEL